MVEWLYCWYFSRGVCMVRSTASVSFIFISDTHVGNDYGICTPYPELGESPTTLAFHEANSLQQKLYSGFLSCVDRIKQPSKIQALFLGGDLVDGPNLRKSAKDLWTVDPIVAVYDFNKLVWPIASKANKVFGIRGSDYHVSPDRTVINYDELACQMLGTTSYKTRMHGEQIRRALSKKVKDLRAKGKKLKDISLAELEQDISKEERYLSNKLGFDITNPWNKGLTKKLDQGNNIFKKEQQSLQLQNQDLPYPITDVRFKGIFETTAIVLKHHVSFSPNYMYRGTGLTRNDLLQTLQKERHYPDGYTTIINAYGHAHYYHLSGNATHFNFVIPCFKANDTYLKQYGVTEPDYGIIEVIREPNDEIIIHPYTLKGDEYPVTEPYRI